MRWIPWFGKLLGGALGVGLALILITAAPAYALTPTAAHHQWTGTGVHLFAGATTVQTVPGLVGALSGAGVGVAATPPGSLYVYSGAGGPVGSFRFPVTGGTLSLSPLSGTIDHRGGIRFTNQATGGSLEVGDFEIVLSATPEITGDVNGNPTVRVGLRSQSGFGSRGAPPGLRSLRLRHRRDPGSGRRRRIEPDAGHDPVRGRLDDRIRLHLRVRIPVLISSRLR
jgi:hypothetical protein